MHTSLKEIDKKTIILYNSDRNLFKNEKFIKSRGFDCGRNNILWRGWWTTDVNGGIVLIERR